MSEFWSGFFGAIIAYAVFMIILELTGVADRLEKWVEERERKDG